jgi:hypothetical protein
MKLKWKSVSPTKCIAMYENVATGITSVVFFFFKKGSLFDLNSGRTRIEI